MHSLLLTLDNDYGRLLSGITHVAGIPSQNHTFYERSTGRLRMCDYIPHNDTNCYVVFQEDRDVVLPTDTIHNSILRGKMLLQDINQGFNILKTEDPSAGVTVQTKRNDAIFLPTQCTSTLLYPKQRLGNSWREDLSLVLLQFWLFAISVYAMVKDSVPHVLAGFAARILLTAWSAYALWRTHDENTMFFTMIGQPGTPCSLEIFSDYHSTRLGYEIPDLILNVSALMISGYLSWSLQKLYNNQSFKCVGAPEHVTKMYKFFMAVQACLQLEAFVLATAMGLWVDQLLNSYIHFISEHTEAYEGLFISTTIILIPWIIMGFSAIRREHRIMMYCFIGLTFAFLVGWSVMFYSQVYRWAYITWPMLGCFTTASMILLVATVVLSVICRMNFGRGLKEYLRAEAALASSNFSPEVFEHDVEQQKNPTSRVSLAELSMKSPVSVEFPVPTYLPTLRATTNHDFRAGAAVRSPGGLRDSDEPYKTPYSVPF